MNWFTIVWLFITFLLLGPFYAVDVYAADDRPNVLVIIADDLGYGETGMMGNEEIPTPGIDALAASGIRCMSGYVTSSYCSTSRAGFFTGRYQSRFGYEMNPTGRRNLYPEAGLPVDQTTFVERLEQSGYVTGLFGKWHLGTVAAKQPNSRGFQHFYGFLHEGHFYVPGPPYENVLTMVRDTSLQKNERLRDGDFIRGNYANMSEPAYDADNPMLRGTEEIIEPDYLTDAITDEAVEFLEEERDAPFCMVVAYNAVHSPMQAKDDDLERLQRIKDDQRRIFAGMLVAMDRGIGRLNDTLAEQGLQRNTLVVFFSDNGGPTAELTSSNAPLRGGKGTLYEGGVRVPMVWSMPGKLPAGVVEDRVVSSLDVSATALDLAGLPSDESADGVSLFDWVSSPDDSPHQQLFWRMPGGRMAFRSGNWKIVRPKRNASVELYHLASDQAEKRNLVSEHPDVLSRLTKQWKAMDAQMVDPIPLRK
ncbi:MAG: sulfatase-like hydrolase/transferase [Planctomycetota bacterium]